MNMRQHDKLAYITSGVAGFCMLVWVLWRGESFSRALGAGMMLGSALFLFVGFFARPKYEFGQFTILQNAQRVNEKLDELEKLSEDEA